MKHIHFKRPTLGGGESHPYPLRQTLACQDRQELVEPILALKDFATGAGGCWLVPRQRHSEVAVLLGQLDPAPGTAVLPGRRSAGMAGSACLKLLLRGVLLPQKGLCWQSSSVQKKPELNTPSCHIPYTSQNRILCSRNRFNTLGHVFQNKSMDPICKQYLVCI